MNEMKQTAKQGQPAGGRAEGLTRERGQPRSGSRSPVAATAKQGQPAIIEANARELHAIELMAGLDCRLVEGQDALRARLETIPNGWRNFRLAAAMVERTLKGIYDTLPPRTLAHMRRLYELGEVIIRPKPLIKMPDDVQIVGTDDLKLLINKAIAAECAICVKDRQGQKKCALRKALMRIAPTREVHRDGSCNYMDVVNSCELENYI